MCFPFAFDWQSSLLLLLSPRTNVAIYPLLSLSMLPSVVLPCDEPSSPSRLLTSLQAARGLAINANVNKQ